MAPLTESPFTKRIDYRVLKYVRKRDVFWPREVVVAGVSGGPDSTALLLILSRLRTELGLRIVVAHFDHMLRSRGEADADRAFVAKLAKALRLPLVEGQGDVKARARRSKESIEEAARYMRYRFLGAETKRAEASAVVIGHTLDDRAETVLMHIIRGAGLDGLAAMPPRAPWPFGEGPEIARPLLGLSRADTVRYCRESGIEPRRDPTNDMLIATRNRVRHEVMPALSKLNPRVSEALVRLAEAASADAEYIAAEADAIWPFVATAEADGVSLEWPAIDELSRAISSRLVQRAARELAPEGEPSAEQVADVLEGRARVSLSGGLTAVRGTDRIAISRSQVKPTKALATKRLTNGKATRFGDWRIELGAKDGVAVSAAAIRGQLTVRSRRAGDRMRPAGLGGTKKVQDIFVDAKVPREDRDGVPIVCDEAGIVCIPGLAVDERVAARAGTAKVVRISAAKIR